MTTASKAPPLSALESRQVQWIGAGYLLAFASMAGQTIFIAQFNTSLRAEFGLSHGQFGSLYTIATLFSSIVLIWAGGLADKIAPRTLGAICLMGLALVALSMATVQNIIWLGVTLFGLRLFGQGMMMHISMTTMSRWFNRFRGRALAIAALGTSTGDALLPFATTLLIASIGWRQSWLVTAGFWLLVLLPAIVFLLRDPPDGKRAVAAGETNPDGDTSLVPYGTQWTRRAVLRDPIFWLIIPGFMGPPAIGTLFLFHQAHLTVLKDWDLTLFTAQFPVLSITAVVTGLVTGNLIDRFSAWRLLPLVLLPQGVGCLLIGFFDPFWLIPLFFMSFGMTAGLMGPTGGALWAELYGTANIGRIRALATSAMVFASAIGPGLAGWLIDANVELNVQAFYYAAYCFVVAVIYWLTRQKFAARIEAINIEKAALQIAPGS